MPSDDIAAAFEGVTKGVLSIGIDKIKDLVKKFRNKELLFINDPQTIDIVKEQLKSGEWSLCKQYLKNREIKILVQMGLALRRLESNPQKLHSLRDKIVERYTSRGLHVAEFVQNNILTEFISSIARKSSSGSEIIEKVETFLLDVDKYVLFIKSADAAEKRIQEVLIKIQANNPDTLVLFSSKSAQPICFEIKEKLELLLESFGYSIETKEEKNRLLIFISKESHNLFQE